MPWQCFLVKDTGMSQLQLRRYKSSDDAPCPRMPGSHSYHQRVFGIEKAPTLKDDEGYLKMPDVGKWKDDPRWPTHCACGYEFLEEDRWQVMQEVIYRAEDGREWEQRILPIGAMLDAWWDFRATPGPDGRRLGVILPPGGDVNIWCIDGPSSSGGGWMRSGEVPNVTAAPSILTSKYHGFLQNGVLTDSLPDRPNPFS